MPIQSLRSVMLMDARIISYNKSEVRDWSMATKEPPVALPTRREWSMSFIPIVLSRRCNDLLSEGGAWAGSTLHIGIGMALDNDLSIMLRWNAREGYARHGQKYVSVYSRKYSDLNVVTF